MGPTCRKPKDPWELSRNSLTSRKKGRDPLLPRGRFPNQMTLESHRVLSIYHHQDMRLIGRRGMKKASRMIDEYLIPTSALYIFDFLFRPKIWITIPFAQLILLPSEFLFSFIFFSFFSLSGTEYRRGTYISLPPLRHFAIFASVLLIIPYLSYLFSPQSNTDLFNLLTQRDLIPTLPKVLFQNKDVGAWIRESRTE